MHKAPTEIAVVASVTATTFSGARPFDGSAKAAPTVSIYDHTRALPQHSTLIARTSARIAAGYCGRTAGRWDLLIGKWLARSRPTASQAIPANSAQSNRSLSSPTGPQLHTESPTTRR